ncbi:MAG: hypothetical protein RL300_1909 [Pseudomonadota bacterium]
MQAAQTPGQQHTGRFAVLDDVARYGRTQAIDLLCCEGAVGLFGHTRPAVADFAAALKRAGVDATPHVWDLYHACLTDALDTTAHVLSASTHADISLSVRDDWGADMTQRSQDKMRQCGIMPASQPTLRGQVVPSLLAIATDTKGQLAGVGSLVWGHCQQGPWQDHAHLGMVSVDMAARGRSLGKRLAAALIQQAAQKGDTAGITAACAGDNPASANLLRACGLQRDEQRLCVMFTLDGSRKTR